MLKWIEVLAPAVISWPVAVLVLALLFRMSIRSLFDAFQRAPGSKAEIGPLKVELGKLAEEGKDAVGRLRQTTELMAESRLLELEITSQMFGAMLTDDQRGRMDAHIDQLRALSSKEGLVPAPRVRPNNSFKPKPLRGSA